MRLCGIKGRRPCGLSACAFTAMIKYILCEPCSGFNDTLSQIDRAWRYALKTQRVLIINTRRGSCFFDDFDNYFTVTAREPRTLCRLTRPLLRHLNSLPTHPRCLQGRLHAYSGFWSEERACLLESSSGMPLSLDFERDYRQPLVVHAASGTGEPVELLSGLRLKSELARSLAASLAVLGEDYDAVHVRNTDYRTAYKAYFLTLASRLKGRTVLVCSDDWKCREAAALMFSGSRVLSLTDIPRLADGEPLHTRPGDVVKNNRDMLLDFIGLAGARALYAAPVDSLGRPGGFGRLALDLNRRKDIYRHFYLEALSRQNLDEL